MDAQARATAFHVCLEISNGCWILLALVWIVGAFRNKRTEQGWGSRARIPYFTLLVLTYWLIFDPRFGPRMLPGDLLVGVIGAGLTVSGFATAVWARLTLASNWSASVAVKESHELVSRGPYRWIRHPIYSGILQAMVGTGLLTGTAGAALGIAIAFGMRIWKLRLEEKLMAEHFPAEYPAYRERTKALVPFVF